MNLFANFSVNVNDPVNTSMNSNIIACGKASSGKD